MSPQPGTLDAALAYAKRGWRVFPIRKGLKTPATKNGFKDATTEAGQLTSWWSEGIDYNVGIATGKDSGITVIDLDGPHTRDVLKAHGLKVPDTYKVRTPNGYHIYLAYDPSIRQTAGGLKAGDECDCQRDGAPKKCAIDVRNDGGYVVAPPSKRDDGGEYKVFKDLPLASWPQIAAELAKPVRNPVTASEKTPGWVSDLLTNGARFGNRNNEAARLAGYFHDLGMPRDVILATMRPFAQKCDPVFDDAELASVIASVTRYSRRKVIAYQGDVLPAPQVDESVSGKLKFMWPEQGIFVEADRIKERTDGVHCWLRISETSMGEIYGPISQNVLQPTFTDRLAKSLVGRHEANWESILQHVRSEVVDSLETNGELVNMTTYQPQSPTPWAMYPFVRKLQPNLFFADGGSTKTTGAIATTMSLASGTRIIPGTDVKERGNVLYLDWETDKDEFATVRDALLKAHPVTLPDDSIQYRRMTGPIESQIDRLMRDVVAYEIKNVVVDSLVKAIGDDVQGPEAARVFFQCLAALETSALILTHISNEMVRRTSATDIRPYGSVFWWDYCRNNWFIKKVQEHESPRLKVGFFHSKLNRGRLLRPLGYELEFEEDSEGTTTFIKYHPSDVREDEILSQGASLKDRVRYELRSGAKSLDELSEKLGHDRDKLRAFMHRYKGQEWTVLPSGQWGLLAPQDDTVTGYGTGYVTGSPPLGGREPSVTGEKSVTGDGIQQRQEPRRWWDD